MTAEQINKLLLERNFPESSASPELIETHISWVFLCDRVVYKIKKPRSYSFLDFSTPQKRKFYCEREIELNKKLTNNIYNDVQTVKEISSQFFIGNKPGEVIDYAVRMQKLDTTKQMDKLLLYNKVTLTDIQNLAGTVAEFHKNTNTIYQKNFLDVKQKFSALAAEIEYLHRNLGTDSTSIINRAIDTSDTFIAKHKELLAARLKAGFFRDCHGDLHSQNIFLLPDPQLVDCIEFNDDYRQIDVMNDVAFLCMELDAFGRQDLSGLFLKCYDILFSSMKTEADRKLFIYYKGYRANVRAKVNSLSARDARNAAERKRVLDEVNKYLQLLNGYMRELETN